MTTDELQVRWPNGHPKYTIEEFHAHLKYLPKGIGYFYWLDINLKYEEYYANLLSAAD
jgi:hypothetical protein